MKQLYLITLFVVLTSCTAFNNCNVSPTVTIDNSKQSSKESNEKENTDKKNTKTLLKDSIENAQPGGQFKCSF